MSEQERIDQEPDKAKTQVTIESGKERRAFSKVRRELSEEELSTPAAHRLLLDALDRLEQEVVQLSDYEDRFHIADKGKAILEERLKTSTAREILYGTCLTVGSILLGLIPFLADNIPYGGYISLGVGVVLMLGGIISKMVKL